MAKADTSRGKTSRGEPAAGERTQRTRGKRSLPDQVAAHVRELIMSGQLRFPEFVRLDQVAGDLGISVTPVREGLLTLRAEGLLQLEPRRGFMVAPLSGDDVRDLFWVQAQLEGELAARATPRLSDDDLATLDELQRGLAGALADGRLDEIEDLNHRFHHLLAMAGRSPKLTRFLGQAVKHTPSRYYETIDGWVQASVDDHYPILDALHARDAEAARTAMQEHIRHAGELLGRHVDRRPED
ncbi:DNA-binding transcriptional regulator, GntR family [Prauserella aidingensis]|uniref:GntR family transcriptional regulator n=1 Tax=Prauserella aidingensis TaxID=387890 RepID=UPI0020A4190D|nr:GntR family transcriptional regulator [Prauserella aidingensis]MCP2254036.1 DNA-binding transcriptional regulator, GntR family [Prauserella aidingensis]